MEIIKINLNNPDLEVIKKAASILEAGGLVIHPTDTAYGIAANVFDQTAIKRVYEVKGREFNKPLIVAVRDFSQAQELVEFNSQGEKLFEKFFPGPLTLILPKKPLVPDIVTNGKPLGIRLPNCQVTLKLSQVCSVPYTTTSANPSGSPTPYSIADILKQFDNLPAAALAKAGSTLQQIDLILDAGPLEVKPTSTVVDLTGEKLKILREGPISLLELEESLHSR